MDLPILIVEFGQQRQRLKLKTFFLTVCELFELVSQLFQTKFDLQKYEILLYNQPLNSLINLDFTQMEPYPRFKIQLCNHSCSSDDEMSSLKQRLNTASMEITEVTVLINSIHTNCKNLIKTLIDEDQQSNNFNSDLIVPPGFQSLSNDRSISAPDSQNTDEGIDRDIGNVSVFESAHSDYQSESIYVECREDMTIINQPNPITNKDRNQPYRSRPHWNSNKVKYPSTYPRDQFGETSRLKKAANPNKIPLPQEKKKNIPCKYAAGGNCKRGKSLRMK